LLQQNCHDIGLSEGNVDNQPFKTACFNICAVQGYSKHAFESHAQSVGGLNEELLCVRRSSEQLELSVLFEDCAIYCHLRTYDIAQAGALRGVSAWSLDIQRELKTINSVLVRVESLGKHYETK
jgi:hypothetical protein